MPEITLKAIMAITISWQLPDVAVLLLISYAGFLRTMEALSLHRWHVLT